MGGYTGDGQFYNPYGVAVDSLGYVYVADTGNYRIQKFAPSSTTPTQSSLTVGGNQKSVLVTVLVTPIPTTQTVYVLVPVQVSVTPTLKQRIVSTKLTRQGNNIIITYQGGLVVRDT